MRQVIACKGAPEAVGNYAQGVRAGNLLFLSGQICLNPETGKLERDSITSQTTRIMENIKAIVAEAGADMDSVVQCNVFLSDMKHFEDFDAVYASYFAKPFPARMTVACAGIYDNLDVEMNATILMS